MNIFQASTLAAKTFILELVIRAKSEMIVTSGVRACYRGLDLKV